ncbi:carboxylesterase 20 [Rutidosis leptorrhynchoides]|uniref:carboxylesterase 20 n=1 Tax=Rutidosis leptorrhynchoides TaxID=125765 RepID=UPI003A9A238E
MSSQARNSDPTSTVDPYDFLQITANPDGTIGRNPNRFPNTSPTTDHPTVFSKDISVNKSTETWARIFLPRKALDNHSKLPVIIYFHGGGFINCSAASTVFHVFCSNMAMELFSIVVSINYRLAPENRLPAAYDDAIDAFHWIKATDENWLLDYADFGQCFVMGTSSGANIAYHASQQYLNSQVNDSNALEIKGLILNQPFFSGVLRTDSELRLINDAVLPLCVADLMWELSLPRGVDRDHEYCNPTVGLEKIGKLKWKVLLTGWDGDPIIDRQVELANAMKCRGVQVVEHFGKGNYHAVEIKEPSKANALYLIIKDFCCR